MSEINEAQEPVEAVEEDVEEQAPEPTDDVETLKAQLQKQAEKGIAQRERTRLMRAEIEKLKKAVQPKEAPSKTTGELDETQLDYLDLKGITEDDDIAVIQKVVARTGQTVRQALKDDYVQEKLKANQAKREVSAATPSSTRRSGSGQQNDVALALARFEATGELPSDFKLRTAVVNAKVDKEAGNKPSWH